MIANVQLSLNQRGHILLVAVGRLPVSLPEDGDDPEKGPEEEEDVEFKFIVPVM